MAGIGSGAVRTALIPGQAPVERVIQIALPISMRGAGSRAAHRQDLSGRHGRLRRGRRLDADRRLPRGRAGLVAAGVVYGIEPDNAFAAVNVFLRREAGRIVESAEIEIDLRREVVVFVRQGTAATATEAAADRRRRAVPCALASAPFDGVLGKGHERGRYAACVPSAAFAMAEIGRQRLAMGLEASRTAKTMPASELRDHERLPSSADPADVVT